MRVCPDCECKNVDDGVVCGWCGGDVSMVDVTVAPEDKRFKFSLTPRQRIYLSWAILFGGGFLWFFIQSNLLLFTALFVRPYRVKLRSWKFVGIFLAILFTGIVALFYFEQARKLVGFFFFGLVTIHDWKAGYLETEDSCMRTD